MLVFPLSMSAVLGLAPKSITVVLVSLVASETPAVVFVSHVASFIL